MVSSTANSKAPALAAPAAAPPRPRSLGRFARRAALFLVLLLTADRLTAAALRHGLDRYYGLNRPAVVLSVGHSRTVLGIDDQKLEQALGVPVAKYAVNGATTADRLAMIKHFLDVHPDTVKVLVYDVSAFTFTDRGLSSNSYKLFYPYLGNPDIADHIRRNAASADEVFWRTAFRTFGYDEVTFALALRGYTGVRGNLKLGAVDVQAVRERVARGESRKMEIDPANVDLFRETIRFARSRGVHVFLTYIPTLDVLSDADRPAHDRIVALLHRIASEDPGVRFLNYNAELEARHELFFDPIHMNAQGQAVITDRLAQDLAPVIARSAASVAVSKP